MRRTSSMIIAACATLALTAATATAQVTADRRTFVTFSGPVTIPGATLPAGTYTFKIADSLANRHIVQVFDKEESKIYATVLAVAAERAEAEGDPVITFKETPSDRPPAVHFWYYAGEKSGNELVYPKDQAMAIARASGESVMSVDCTDMKDCKGDMTRINADGTSTASSTSTASPEPQQPATMPEPQPAPTTAQPTTMPEPQPAPTTAQPSTAPVETSPVGTSGREELPRTASPLPLVGLIGLLSLAGALALRAARA